MQFTAIVNPHSGPGEGALPNDIYTQAIQSLNALDNVRTIGYVATTWCEKNVSSVLDEVAVYVGWGDHDSSLAMSGIFFDEIPTRHTPEYVSYLRSISDAVRSHNGGLRDGYIGKSKSFISALGVLCGCWHSPKSVGPDIWAPPSYRLPPFESTVFSLLDEFQQLGRLLSAVVSVRADDALQSTTRVLCLKHNTLTTQTSSGPPISPSFSKTPTPTGRTEAARSRRPRSRIITTHWH